jgi:hypothetical protein
MIENDRTFRKWLLIGNAVLVAVFAALGLLYVAPNCPGPYCNDQTKLFVGAALLTIISLNLFIVSLRFALRVWRK